MGNAREDFTRKVSLKSGKPMRAFHHDSPLTTPSFALETNLSWKCNGDVFTLQSPAELRFDPPQLWMSADWFTCGGKAGLSPERQML